MAKQAVNASSAGLMSFCQTLIAIMDYKKMLGWPGFVALSIDRGNNYAARQQDGWRWYF